MPNSCNILYDLAGMSQPTPTSCWATAFAIVINQRKYSSYTPEDIAAAVGKDLSSYSSDSDERAVANEFGLSFQYTRVDDIDAMAMMLQSYGPLYLTPDNTDHCVVLFGLRHDDDGTQWQLYDPWKGEAPITVSKLKQAMDTLNDDSSIGVYY